MSGKQTVLVTGGFGFVGAWISQYLAEDYDLYILSKGNTRQVNCDFTFIKVDITDKKSLKIIEDKKFDYVIHGASLNEHFNPDYSTNALLVNSLGTKNLIESLIKNRPKKFIYLSTFHVYGLLTGKITETTECKPSSDYGLTHLFAEHYVKMLCSQNDMQFTIIRLTNCYGAPKTLTTDKWYLVFNDFVKSAFLDGKINITGDPSAVRDFVWLGDICYVIKALLSSAGQLQTVYNLGSKFVFSNYELAKIIKKSTEAVTNNHVRILSDNPIDGARVPLCICNKRIRSEVGLEFSNKIEEETKNIIACLET